MEHKQRQLIQSIEDLETQVRVLHKKEDEQNERIFQIVGFVRKQQEKDINFRDNFMEIETSLLKDHRVFQNHLDEHIHKLKKEVRTVEDELDELRAHAGKEE